MSEAWLPIATAGCLDARIFTAARLREMGMQDLEHPFLVIMLPDGDEPDPQPVWMTSLDALVRWCGEMRPRALYAHTAGEPDDIHCDDLIAQCRAGSARH